MEKLHSVFKEWWSLTTFYWSKNLLQSKVSNIFQGYILKMWNLEDITVFEILNLLPRWLSNNWWVEDRETLSSASCKEFGTIWWIKKNLGSKFLKQTVEAIWPEFIFPLKLYSLLKVCLWFILCHCCIYTNVPLCSGCLLTIFFWSQNFMITSDIVWHNLFSLLILSLWVN